MTNKTSLIYLVIAAVSFSAGKFLSPPQVELREVERVVYKESVETTENRTRKETVLPDGTIIKEEITINEQKKQIDLDRESDKSQITQNRPDWRLNFEYYPTLPGFQNENASVGVQRRILSELYLGVSVTTQKTIGLSVGLGF